MASDQFISININSNYSKVAGFLNSSKKDSASIFHSILETHGISRGQIKNLELAQKSISKGIEEIKKNLLVKKLSAYVSFSSTTLKSQTGSATIALSRADGDVTGRDIERIMSEIERKNTKTNQKILFIEPICFFIDDVLIEGRPEGLKGSKLTCESIIISVSSQIIKDIESIMNHSKVEIIEIIPDALTCSSVVLSDRDMYAGCALVNIGEDTTSLAVYDNGNLIFLKTYPIGTSDIVNDLALYFQIDIKEAENLRNGIIIGNYPQKKVDDISTARIEDIFKIINKDIKILNLEGLLPAGIYICGNGALINNIEDVAKKIMKIPAKIATAKNIEQNIKIKDASWMSNYNFLISKTNLKNYSEESDWIKELKNSIKKIIKQLTP